MVTTGIEIYQAVDDFMKQYDTYRIRPDMARMGPDGEVAEIFDYKFDYPDGGKDTMSADQRALYDAKAGQKPTVIDKDFCKCID